MQSANILAGFAHYFSPKIPMIFSVGMTQQPAWHYWFYGFLRKRPTLTICNSKRIRKELTERSRLPEEKVRVLYNPLDTEQFHPFDAKEKEKARAQFGFEQGSLVFATIGRISHQKNQWGTVRALRHLKEKGQLPERFKMLFIGKRHSSHYDRELRRMIQEAGLDENCVLREPLENILTLYNAVDGVFLPSHHEGLCNVAIECQASGTPVALSLEGDNDQLIRDGDTGFSFSIARDVEVAEGLKRLIDLCGNPEKKAALTSQAREEVRKKFSLKEAIELREAMYESLMK
jgi:glycosyltransferase involved in cell wall biosynthesis